MTTSAQACAAKLGEPYRMAECGKPIVFLTAEMLGTAEGGISGMFSGWYHSEPQDDRSHWPVPKHEL